MITRSRWIRITVWNGDLQCLKSWTNWRLLIRRHKSNKIKVGVNDRTVNDTKCRWPVYGPTKYHIKTSAAIRLGPIRRGTRSVIMTHRTVFLSDKHVDQMSEPAVRLSWVTKLYKVFEIGRLITGRLAGLSRVNGVRRSIGFNRPAWYVHHVRLLHVIIIIIWFWYFCMFTAQLINKMLLCACSRCI